MQSDGFEGSFHTLFLNFLTSIGFLHTFASFTEYRNPKASHSYPAFFCSKMILLQQVDARFFFIFFIFSQ